MTNLRLAISLIENIEKYNQPVNTNGKISIMLPCLALGRDFNEFINKLMINLMLRLIAGWSSEEDRRV